MQCLRCLAVLGALQAASALPCEVCDNGGKCGVCLNVVDSTECPAADRVEHHCEGIAIGSICEADGECGTDNHLDNCPGRHHGMDVYRRVTCDRTTPAQPPAQPSPPLPACDTLACDAGTSCGVCLMLLGPSETCPQFWESDWVLHTCDVVDAGELCEADGECGTTNEADNCGGGDPVGDGGGEQHGGGGSGQHGWNDQRPIKADVYRRVACAYPPSPPTPPSPPPFPCGACDAGGGCGTCLQLVPQDECPSAYHSDRELRNCSAAVPGELCEGDGECGTDQAADNCRGADGEPDPNGAPHWSVHHSDVYRVLDCTVFPSSGAPATAATASAVASPIEASDGGAAPASDPSGSPSQPGGMVGVGWLVLFVFASFAAGATLATKYNLPGAASSFWQTAHVFGTRRQRQSPTVTVGTPHPITPSPLSSGLSAPLTANQAPMGFSSIVVDPAAERAQL